MNIYLNTSYRSVLTLDICDFDFSIATKYCLWYFGNVIINENNLKQYGYRSSGHKNIYEFMVPSLFYESVDIYNEKINFKNIDLDLVSIFDEEHFRKLINHWSSRCFLDETFLDLKQNYNRYIEQANIKSIIE